jgi:gluconate 2-dehydrogenase gamma chain
MKCTRRQLLVGFFGLAAGSTVAGRFAFRGGPAAVPPRPTLPFPPPETRALNAAFEHALPGAIEAGVPDHVAWWLTNDRYFKSMVPDFLEGAQQLDRVAQEMHKKIFAECSSEQRDQIFSRFQSGGVRSKTFDGARFFERLITFTLEGFLGDPKYGGNRDQVGWKFIGFKPCWWAPREAGAEGVHDHAHMGH